MKHLYIVRHAEAAPGAHDHQRSLTTAGKVSARKLGETMVARDYNPARILCSDARRTRETLAAVNPLAIKETHFDKKIYGADVGDLLTMIQAINDDASSLLLVGHNPAVHGLARLLAGAGKDVPVLDVQYPPCTLAVLSCEAAWRDWAPGCAVLTDFLPGGQV